MNLIDLINLGFQRIGDLLHTINQRVNTVSTNVGSVNKLNSNSKQLVNTINLILSRQQDIVNWTPTGTSFSFTPANGVIEITVDGFVSLNIVKPEVFGIKKFILQINNPSGSEVKFSSTSPIDTGGYSIAPSTEPNSITQLGFVWNVSSSKWLLVAYHSFIAE